MSTRFCAVDQNGRRALFLVAQPGGPVVGAIHRGRPLPLDEAIHLWRSRQWQQVAHSNQIEPKAISQLEQ